ncbi:MAG: hypothetical protein RL757_1715 [Bacteroidota bacterium]|jgi:ribosome recycling factor
MDSDIELMIEMAEDAMKYAIDHLAIELNKIKAGKATPAMVSGLMVMYYGTGTPLNQVASVSNADARTLVIQPWEKNMLSPIEKAIFEANMGMTPQNDGQVIRLMIPPLTEERRRDMVRKAKAVAEESKVGVRNARRDAMEAIKKEVKNGFPEDAGKKKEAEVQVLTDRYSKRIEEIAEAKEKEIMTV